MEGLISPNFQNIKEFEPSISDFDFIPYACHYNNHTILTKNGELLQTIKLVGFSSQLLAADFIEIKNIIKKAIDEEIRDHRFAIDFHTIRVKQNINPSEHFHNEFANYVHQAWENKNYWHDKYVNELYITFTFEGLYIDFNLKNIFIFLNPKKLYSKHEKYLQNIYQKLDKSVTNILSILEPYGAKRLSIIQDYNDISSEYLNFFHKIITSKSQHFSLPVIDLSGYLTNFSISNTNNVVKLTPKDNEKEHTYAAVITIKHYSDTNEILIDEILQLPETLIISEKIDSVSRAKAIETFKYQKYILDLSQDELLQRKILFQDSIDNIDDSFCLHQLNIKVISDNLEDLDHKVKLVITSLNKNGIIAIREDLNMLNCYWAQLPGNFRYLNRQTVTNKQNIGIFASLHNFSVGRYENIWGKALTLFRTKSGAPYFFNLHVENNGNNLIIGPKNTGKTIFLNFLLTFALKYEPQIFMFSNDERSTLFANIIDAKITHIDQFIPFNPFNNFDKKSWLRQWIQEYFGFDIAENNFSNYQEFLDYTQQHHPSQFEIAKAWEVIFSGESELVFDKHNLFIITQNEGAKDALLSYYLYNICTHIEADDRIILSFDNLAQIATTPALISQVNNMITSYNSNIIFLASINYTDLSLKSLSDKCLTKIFLPIEEIDQEISKTYNLTKDECKLLQKMRPITRSFILKQQNDNIIAELNITNFHNIISILSANDTNTQHALSYRQESPENWFQVFFNNL